LRLNEELRHQRDVCAGAEKAKRLLEAQVREVSVRLEESEAVAAKGGKRLVQKLEQRVAELEAELDAEQKVNRIEKLLIRVQKTN